MRLTPLPEKAERVVRILLAWKDKIYKENSWCRKFLNPNDINFFWKKTIIKPEQREKFRKSFTELLEDARKKMEDLRYDIGIVLGIIMISIFVIFMILEVINNIRREPTESSRNLPKMIQKQNHDQLVKESWFLPSIVFFAVFISRTELFYISNSLLSF